MRLEADDTRWLIVHPGGDEHALAIRDSRQLLDGDAIAEDVFFERVSDAIECIQDRMESHHRIDFVIDLRRSSVRLLRRDGAGDGVFFAVVFPRGDVDEVSVAELQDFDMLDYAYAYPFSFDSERDADAKAGQIAAALGLKFESELDSESPSP